MEKINEWDLEKIQNYLIKRVSEAVEINPDDMVINKTFSEYSIDSSAGIALSGDIEEEFNLKLSPTLLFEYPTVEKLSKYLLKQIIQ